jgi:hypothetical protein
MRCHVRHVPAEILGVLIELVCHHYRMFGTFEGRFEKQLGIGADD